MHDQNYEVFLGGGEGRWIFPETPQQLSGPQQLSKFSPEQLHCQQPTVPQQHIASPTAFSLPPSRTYDEHHSPYMYCYFDQSSRLYDLNRCLPINTTFSEGPNTFPRPTNRDVLARGIHIHALLRKHKIPWAPDPPQRHNIALPPDTSSSLFALS